MKPIKAVFLAILFISSIAFTIFSCRKENQAPVVIFKEPSDNDTIAVADTMLIKGTVADDENLHEMSVLVIKSTGDTALQDSPYVHDLKAYGFYYLFHTSVAGTYTVKVTAEDHKKKSTTATRTILVM